MLFDNGEDLTPISNKPESSYVQEEDWTRTNIDLAQINGGESLAEVVVVICEIPGGCVAISKIGVLSQLAFREPSKLPPLNCSSPLLLLWNMCFPLLLRGHYAITWLVWWHIRH